MKSIFTTYTTAICILSFTLPGVRQEKSCPSMQPPLIEESLTIISQQYHMISHHHKFTINTDLSFLAYSAVGTCAFLLAKFIKIHFVIHIYQKVTRSVMFTSYSYRIQKNIPIIKLCRKEINCLDSEVSKAKSLEKQKLYNEIAMTWSQNDIIIILVKQSIIIK